MGLSARVIWGDTLTLREDGVEYAGGAAFRSLSPADDAGRRARAATTSPRYQRRAPAIAILTKNWIFGILFLIILGIKKTTT